VFLHAIIKKTAKVSDVAIDKSIEYKLDYESRYRQEGTP